MHIFPANYIDFPPYPTGPTRALEELSASLNNITLYYAGLPNYPYIFTRDSLLSAILLNNTLMLKDQLIYASLLQGAKKDPFTGEEPGKIFHQMPGVIQRGLSTEYNACDTTALFIIGHHIYFEQTKDAAFIDKQKKYIEKAVSYILNHLVNNLFVEDPLYSGARRFGLKLTYWKDSQVPNREDGKPSYPAVFTLAHVQNMKALKCAAKILDQKELTAKAEEMRRYLFILFDDKRGIFHAGLDKKGFFPGLNSDNLHILYYLDKEDLPEEKVMKIVKASRYLETEIGYMTLNSKDQWLSGDITRHTGYHTDSVWSFEQAFIHAGARKFNITSVMEVSRRIYPHIKDQYPELFIFRDGRFEKKGSRVQLWTIAASEYFAKNNI